MQKFGWDKKEDTEKLGRPRDRNGAVNRRVQLRMEGAEETSENRGLPLSCNTRKAAQTYT